MDEWQRERWRGEVDSEIKTIGRRLGEIEKDIGGVEKGQRDIELKVQALATKIAIYSSLGAMFGGGIMSLVVGLFFRHGS